MAGEAKTSKFVLSTATVMVGPQADVFDFTPSEHSIGLVKNFTMTSEPAYTELTQGVKNTIVYSVMTANPVRCTMEVYEYTAKNIKIGLGLSGSDVAIGVKGTVAVSGLVGDSTLEVVGDFSTSAGKTIMLQVGNTDLVTLVKVTSAVYSAPNTVLTIPPLVNTVGIGVRVWQANEIEVGSKEEQPFLGAKIVGILPEDNEPITIVIPKLRVVKGFNLAFSSENYGNMPFEFTPYDLISTDPFYGDFSGVAKLFTRG